MKSILKLCSPTLLSDVLPYDGSCEDIEADPGLAFLDSFVQASLQNGARPYSKDLSANDQDDEINKANKSKSNKDQSLIFAYEDPPKDSPKLYSQEPQQQHQQQHQQHQQQHRSELVSAKESHDLPSTGKTNAVCSSPQSDNDYMYVFYFVFNFFKPLLFIFSTLIGLESDNDRLCVVAWIL